MRTRLTALAVLAAVALTTAVAASVPQSAQGAAATYKLSYVTLPNGSKVPLRWNGCQRWITYKVNLSAVPSAQRKAVLAETRASILQLSAATKFNFAYKGSTTEVPRVGSLPKQSAELIIAFTTPSKTNYNLSGSVLGQGGFYAGWASRTVNGRTTYTAAATRGFVVIDAPQMLREMRSGYGTGARRSNLLAHELGHAMGLQHVTTKSQQMYPSITTASPKLFATGDRAGLAKIGRGAGCINTALLSTKDLS